MASFEVFISWVVGVIGYTVGFAYDEVALNMYQNFYNCWFLKLDEAPDLPYEEFCWNATARGATTNEYDQYALKWALLASSYLGCSTMATFIFPLGDKYGRKALLLVGGVSGLLGNLFWLMAFYKNNYMLMVVGQITASIKCGLGLMSLPLYLVEIAPEGREDAFGVSFSFGFALGHVLGVGLGLEEILGKHDKWQYSMWIGMAFNIFQLALHPFAMESPSWIQEKSNTGKLTYVQQLKKMGSDVKILLADKERRSKFIYTVLITISFLCCGTDLLYQYSFGILQGQGLSSKHCTYISVATLFAAACASLIGLYTLPKLGKRKSFLVSTTGMLIFIVIFYIIGEVKSNGDGWLHSLKIYVTAGSMMGLLLSAEVGALPVVFTLPACWFEPNVRLTVNAFSVLCGTSILALEVFLFPQLIIWYGQQVFLLPTIVTGILLLLGYVKIKYGKGKVYDADEKMLGGAKVVGADSSYQG